jgi:hypothetical protein
MDVLPSFQVRILSPPEAFQIKSEIENRRSKMSQSGGFDYGDKLEAYPTVVAGQTRTGAGMDYFTK